MVIYALGGVTERGQAYDLLRQGAKECWGMDVLPAIERQPGGKPFFAEEKDRHFNLSHSGTWALCALDGQPVGVDIQEVRAWKSGLVDRVCSVEEKVWLAEQTVRDQAFALLWALKESRVKYEGRGIIGTGEMIRGIRVPLMERPEGCAYLDGLWFRTYVGGDWAAAVCGLSCPPAGFIWQDNWE